MKLTRWLNYLLIFTLCFLPLICLAAAADKKWYVGINENDEYIYLLTIDEDPYEDYLETIGYTDEEIEIIIDMMDLDEDYEAIKIYILKINDEEHKYDGSEGVKYYYNRYVSEDRAADNWELQGHNKEGFIFKYTDQRKLYKDGVSASRGLGAFFVGNDVDWKHLASKVNDRFEDWYHKRDAGAKGTNNGISTFYKPETFGKTYLEKFRSKSIYNSHGVLTYYEWSYDNELILKYELEMAFFFEYWVIVLIIAVIALIIVIISIKKSESL